MNIFLTISFNICCGCSEVVKNQIQQKPDYSMTLLAYFQVILAQCVVYLSRAPKSVEVYSAYDRAKKCVRSNQGPLPSVPLHLRNAPTKLMKDLGKDFTNVPRLISFF